MLKVVFYTSIAKNIEQATCLYTIKASCVPMKLQNKFYGSTVKGACEPKKLQNEPHGSTGRKMYDKNSPKLPHLFKVLFDYPTSNLGS